MNNLQLKICENIAELIWKTDEVLEYAKKTENAELTKTAGEISFKLFDLLNMLNKPDIFRRCENHDDI